MLRGEHKKVEELGRKKGWPADLEVDGFELKLGCWRDGEGDAAVVLSPDRQLRELWGPGVSNCAERLLTEELTSQGQERKRCSGKIFAELPM